MEHLESISFKLKMGQLSCDTDHARHWMTEELKFDSQKG
jgi:hypothetical protein